MKQNKLILVYPGGFQPFHAGHMTGWNEAKQAFPGAEFYVAASDSVKTRPIPFADKRFLAKQAGIKNNFVRVKSPLDPQEILRNYNKNTDILIIVRSEKDPMRFTSGGYYQPFKSIKNCKPFGQHGYIFTTHIHKFKVYSIEVTSGSQIRSMYKEAHRKAKDIIIQDLYPNATDPEKIKTILDKYLGNYNNEELEISFTKFLMEGVHDAAIFKAVFLAGGPGCFHGDTEILMENGSKTKISQIAVGSTIRSGNKVSKVFKHDATKTMVEIYFNDGHSVICTEDHKFLIGSKWIEAKNLMIVKNTTIFNDDHIFKEQDTEPSTLKVIAIRHLLKSEYPEHVFDLCVEPSHQYELANGQVVHNSGKDYILDNSLSGHGLTEISSDTALEFLMGKEGLSLKMPESEKEKRDLVRTKAKNITEIRQYLALIGRNGLIINGTGHIAHKIKKIKSTLEDLGYDTSMVFVYADDATSKARNIERGNSGGRTIPEEDRKKRWKDSMDARQEFKKMFGDNYAEIDNSKDLRIEPPNVVKAKKDEMLQLYKSTNEFVSTPPKSKTSSDWTANELNKKDTLPITRGGSELTPHIGSKSAESAKKLGLEYYGFGRWGLQGKVLYRSVHGNLVKVLTSESYQLSKIQPTNILILEAPVKDARAKNTQNADLLKGRNGEVLVFNLRRSAVKCANSKKGKVIIYNKGFAVQLKGDNKNDKNAIRYVGFNEGEEGYHSSMAHGRGGSTSGTVTENPQEKDTKIKLTLAQIRQKR